MPEPIEYLVLLNLQAALQAIAVDDGFHYDVRGTAVKLDPNHDVESLVGPDAPRPFIVIEVNPATWDYRSEHGTVRQVLAWTIHWVHVSRPDRDEDKAQTFYRGCADVERAICQDTGRGGQAIDTRVVKCEMGGTDGAEVWAAVDVEIALRRIYGQPDA